jgi:hypothetical protein
MYSMPGEVLNGEPPGLFGLNLYQLFAIVGAVTVGSSLVGRNIIGYLVLGALAYFFAKRVKGLYLAEYLYQYARWLVVSLVATQLQTGEADPDDLNPSKLYLTRPREVRGSVYILRRPDSGETVTVRT